MTNGLCRKCAEPVGCPDRHCEKCRGRVADRRRDRVEVDVGIAAGVSDRGLRHHRNEDALALREANLGQGPARRVVAVAIVCDGVSSSAHPEQASEIAAEIAADAVMAGLRAENGPVTVTREAIHAASKAVVRLANTDPSGTGRCAGADRAAPACTVVSAVVTPEAVTVGWLGDSRAYWIPQAGTGNAPTRLTNDDSWLAQVLAAGTLSPTQAAADRRAHAITAWLGEDADHVDPHITTIEPAGPGVVVVCTDGLWNYLDSVEELKAALPAQALDAPLHAARSLVEVALRCGGRDNITVAVLPFVPDGVDRGQ